MFLGIEIDTGAVELRLPERKLWELQELTQDWLGRRSYSKRDLQSLVGKLQHACKVVHPGRSFLRRMFELLGVAAKKHHHIRLNAAFRSDLLWWHTFLVSWNRTSYLQELCPRPPDIHVYTNASGLTGCGAVWDRNWFQVKWAGSKMAHLPITQKEVLPVIQAFPTWGTEWQHLRVLIHCDNQAAVAVLNSGYSKDPFIMHLLRCAVFIKALRSLDAVSQGTTLQELIIEGQMPYLGITCKNFFSQVPSASPQPTQVPAKLLALLTVDQPDWTSVAWTKLFANCFQPVLPSPQNVLMHQGASDMQLYAHN